MERVYTTPRLDKLGVRPGCRIAVIGFDSTADAAFLAELRERTQDIELAPAPESAIPAPDTDLVFLAADSSADLALLPDLRTRIRPNGAIWVVSRKGRAATLRDVEVIAAAKGAGLVDNKVASFDDARTSLRLVIPLADRPR